MSQIAQNRYNTTFREALNELTSHCMEKSNLKTLGCLLCIFVSDLRDYVTATGLNPEPLSSLTNTQPFGQTG